MSLVRPTGMGTAPPTPVATTPRRFLPCSEASHAPHRRTHVLRPTPPLHHLSTTSEVVRWPIVAPPECGRSEGNRRVLPRPSRRAYRALRDDEERRCADGRGGAVGSGLIPPAPMERLFSGSGSSLAHHSVWNKPAIGVGVAPFWWLFRALCGSGGEEDAAAQHVEAGAAVRLSPASPPASSSAPGPARVGVPVGAITPHARCRGSATPLARCSDSGLYRGRRHVAVCACLLRSAAFAPPDDWIGREAAGRVRSRTNGSFRASGRVMRTLPLG